MSEPKNAPDVALSPRDNATVTTEFTLSRQNRVKP